MRRRYATWTPPTGSAPPVHGSTATALAARVEQLIAATPPGLLDRLPHSGVDDGTPILIVGMPRSGTTLVEQILSSHPQVAAGGELQFWGSRDTPRADFWSVTETPEATRRMADDYLAVLRAIAPAAARVTDKMPFNFALLGLIHRVFPRRPSSTAAATRSTPACRSTARTSKSPSISPAIAATSSSSTGSISD